MFLKVKVLFKYHVNNIANGIEKTLPTFGSMPILNKIKIKKTSKIKALVPIMPKIKNSLIIFLDRNFTIYTPYYHSHFISAFLMFKDSPIIGQGANTYRLKCHEFDFKIHDKSCTTHPHNLNLQFLAELGFIGYLFYLFFLYFLIKKIFFNYNKDKFSYDLNLNFFFVVNLFPLISSGNFFNNWQSILFFLPLGFLINNHYKVKK